MTTIEETLLNAARMAAHEMGNELLEMSWFFSNWAEIDRDQEGESEAA